MARLQRCKGTVPAHPCATLRCSIRCQKGLALIDLYDYYVEFRCDVTRLTNHRDRVQQMITIRVVEKSRATQCCIWLMRTMCPKTHSGSQYKSWFPRPFLERKPSHRTTQNLEVITPRKPQSNASMQRESTSTEVSTPKKRPSTYITPIHQRIMDEQKQEHLKVMASARAYLSQRPAEPSFLEMESKMSKVPEKAETAQSDGAEGRQ